MKYHPTVSSIRGLRRLSAGMVSALLICAIVPPATAAQERPAVGPGLNSYYRNADVARWQGIFERPGREIFDQRLRILQKIGLRPGMDVADVGAGTGFFTLLFAEAVGPAGKVYAVDISENFVADIRRRAARHQMDNVEAILNEQRDTRLPADSVDLVFVCDTYHHFEYPRAMLDSIARALRPGGELVVIDFRRIPGVSTPWVMSHVRAAKEKVTTEIRAAGFALVEEQDFMRENYFLRFRKVSS
ncbi:MAG: methyltransferase domain-containing protein [Pseudomonadota bacterium]|nr:methyltransferase domain-containing protein [Pseudomonadota bacterium]